MKVCTDACVFGAWFAKKGLNAKEILDIGSGTGLLMLMLAQKMNSHFTGIEIDPSCFQQLKENVSNSKWNNRIRVEPGDVRNLSTNIKFDFIISNPPFYENNLESESNEINTARHSKELTLEELMMAIDDHLSEDGSFALLLPYYRISNFEKLAQEKEFHLAERLLLKQTPTHKYFRGILHYSRRDPKVLSEKELIIQERGGNYTQDFVELLKEYYLYLDSSIPMA